MRTIQPVALFFGLAVAVVGAQRPPKADVTPLVETDGVHAGTTVHVALRVILPSGIHVQADKPRDPSLIATALTFAAPAGVTITEIAYPDPTDLVQAGQAQPLAVFEQTFAIGVQLALDRTLAPGDLLVPARLRYQACDARFCFAPAREEVRWTLRVVPAATPTPVREKTVFDLIRFRQLSTPATAR